MLYYVAPTFDKSLTMMALLLCGLLILTPTDYRWASLTFLAGAGLGYFLELWGTTVWNGLKPVLGRSDEYGPVPIFRKTNYYLLMVMLLLSADKLFALQLH